MNHQCAQNSNACIKSYLLKFVKHNISEAQSRMHRLIFSRQAPNGNTSCDTGHWNKKWKHVILTAVDGRMIVFSNCLTDSANNKNHITCSCTKTVIYHGSIDTSLHPKVKAEYFYWTPFLGVPWAGGLLKGKWGKTWRGGGQKNKHPSPNFTDMSCRVSPPLWHASVQGIADFAFPSHNPPFFHRR